MILSRKQQQRDAAVLQLLSTLPTHPYDLERQLLALGQWWSTHGAVNQWLKRLQPTFRTNAWCDV